MTGVAKSLRCRPRWARSTVRVLPAIIGLVPPVDVDRIIAVGNSAGEGAKIALLSYRERQVAFELSSRIEYIELSGRTDFNDSFVSVLGFPHLEAAASVQGS